MARSALVGALRITIGIDTAAFEQGLNRVEKQLRQVGKRMQQVGRQMSAAITAPLVLAGGAALSFAADFEAAMSRVSAVLRPTETEFKMLSDLARELGRTTKFTAAQAADGLEMLARNGLEASQILDGAAQATLNLASAAGAELAPAADVMTDLMVNFGLSGEALAKSVDNVAGTLVNSKLAWDDYASAVGQAAGVAGPMGMSLEDMNAALAATASSFASGEEAGTSFKGMLLRMAPSGAKAKKIIKDLGLEFFDAAGNLKALEDIAEELRVGLRDLTRESQLEALGALFGTRTIRTAVRLMEEGREGIVRLKAEMADVSAAEMAAARLDNFNGALLMLRSAVEGLAIEIANAGLLDWARAFVERLTEIVRSLTETNPAILRWGTIIAGLAAAIGPVILTLGLFAAAIGAIGVPLAAMVVAIGAAGAAVMAFWGDIKTLWRGATQAFENIYNSAKIWLIDNLKPLFRVIGEAARALGFELDGLFGKVSADAVAKAAAEGGLAGVRRVFAEAAAESKNAAEESIGPWLTVTNKVKEELSGTETLASRAAEAAAEASKKAADKAKNAWGELADTMAEIGHAFEFAFVDAVTGARKLSDVLNSLLKDLARIAAQRVFQQLFGGFFGGTQGGLNLPGFAAGGAFTVGGAGGVDSQVVAFRATPGERVIVSKNGNDGDGAVAVMQPRVVVNNYADASVEPRSREDGTLELTVRAIARDEFASERMNPIMRNKHGLAPRLRAR